MRSVLAPVHDVRSVALDEVPRVRGAFGPLPDDAELVRRAREHERWAEEALYRRHAPRVLRIALRLLSRSSDSDDVVQEAFVIAFTNLGELDDPGAFGAWLLRITVRQVHRRYRRRRLLRTLGLDRGEDDALLVEQLDPAAGPETHAALAELERVLASLPTRQRVAWMLRWVEGQKIDEVASACACSRATAKRLISSANRRVQAFVQLEPEGALDD